MSEEKNKHNNDNDNIEIDDIDEGEDLIKIHFNQSYLFKKQIELLKNIVSCDFSIIFNNDKTFKIIYKNCNSNLISYFEFNFNKDGIDENDYYFNDNRIKNYRYIITLDINILHSVVSTFNDNDELNIIIKRQYKNYLIFQTIDNDNKQDQISTIKLLLNDNNIISQNDNTLNNLKIFTSQLTIIISSNMFKKNCNTLKKGDKTNIYIQFNKKNHQNKELNELKLRTFNSSTSSTISMKDIIIKKNKNNISNLSNIYPLDFINHINNSLCYANSLYISFSEINKTKNYCLIIQYVLKNSDGIEYGIVKHIIVPLIKNN